MNVVSLCMRYLCYRCCEICVCERPVLWVLLQVLCVVFLTGVFCWRCYGSHALAVLQMWCCLCYRCHVFTCHMLAVLLACVGCVTGVMCNMYYRYHVLAVLQVSCIACATGVMCACDTGIMCWLHYRCHVLQVSCGSWHGAAVTVSGGLMVWGHRKGCGIPTAANSATNNKQTSSIVTRPYILLTANEHRVVGVACGHNFTLVWTQEGRVLSWGSGHHGVLGHGSNDDVASPRLLQALQGENITEASAGYSHSAFVAADGRVYTCGKGKDGALGLGEGSLSDIAKPKLVAFPDKEQVVKVSCSVGEHHGHTLALTSEGRVFSWGDGYKGKLGLGNQDSHYAPTPIPASYFNTECITVVCAGGIHSTAATAEGSVFTWGCGSDGRLGHPEGQSHRYLFRSDVPKKVEGLDAKSKRALVSCTYYHTAAVIE